MGRGKGSGGAYFGPPRKNCRMAKAAVACRNNGKSAGFARKSETFGKRQGIFGEFEEYLISNVLCAKNINCKMLQFIQIFKVSVVAYL